MIQNNQIEIPWDLDITEYKRTQNHSDITHQRSEMESRYDEVLQSREQNTRSLAKNACISVLFGGSAAATYMTGFHPIAPIGLGIMTVGYTLLTTIKLANGLVQTAYLEVLKNQIENSQQPQARV